MLILHGVKAIERPECLMRSAQRYDTQGSHAAESMRPCAGSNLPLQTQTETSRAGIGAPMPARKRRFRSCHLCRTESLTDVRSKRETAPVTGNT